MKTIKLFLAIVISCTSFSAIAQTKTDIVKVWGNCGMCETRIVKAAKDAGATSAKWDAETNMLSVAYKTSKTSLAKIEEKVASVGHDTKTVKANDEVYSKLHGCCKYERVSGATATASCCTDHEKCKADGTCKMQGTEACKMKNGETCKMVEGKSCCAKS